MKISRGLISAAYALHFSATYPQRSLGKLMHAQKLFFASVLDFVV